MPLFDKVLARRGPSLHVRSAAAAMLLALLVGCVAAPPPPPSTAPEELARRQRVERAELSLNNGLKQYDAGSYAEAMNNFLVALDSGVLPPAQQLIARKHMAFIQCVNSRELACKEEFEKAFQLDPKFELLPAEAGHPTWGPIFRLVKTEIELRKSGKSLPVLAAKIVTPGEKLVTDATAAYDEADYPKAIKLFQDALKETPVASDQVQIHKFIAFSYCLTMRLALCRMEFEKLLQLDPSFELNAAEAGHPSWGPPFRTVKARQKQAQTPAPAPAKK